MKRGSEVHEIADVSCNLCGHSCALTEAGHVEMGGLIKARVSGGYFSTPGNGSGALDDTTSYHFSLCEFCLDWLFGKFTIPVATSAYMDGDHPDEPWRPAAERVAADDWRKAKGQFAAESSLRDAAREAKR